MELALTLFATGGILYGSHISGILGMAVSYRGKSIKAFSAIVEAAQLKLDRVQAAIALQDLAALPGNRFEKLEGDRNGQYSICINDQWRICFEWPAGSRGPGSVEIVDQE